MTVETDFYALLTGSAGMTALVAQRIYPDILPEKAAWPAIVFARQATEHDRLIDGTIAATRVELSVQVWAETRTSAAAVSDAIEAALVGSEYMVLARADAADPETGLLGCLLAIDRFI
jgi:hypothetical protein